MNNLSPLVSNKKNTQLIGVLLFLLFNSSTNVFSQEPPVTKIAENTFRLIGEQQLKKATYFKNTIVGGISGIDMNPDGTFYLISDDISSGDPSRFYTANLQYDDQSFQSITFTSVVYLKTPQKKVFPPLDELNSATEKEVANAESIRYHSETNSLFWTSEGLNAIQLYEPIQPFVRQMNLKGEIMADISTPEQFKYNSKNNKMGLRTNAAFESLSLIPGSNELVIATEAPLFQDGLRPDCKQGGAPIRIVRINWKTNQQIAQYAYVPDQTPIAPIPGSGKCDNGVTEILAIDTNRLLILERSYSEGHPIAEGNSIRVYEIDLSNAVKLNDNSSLAIGNFKPIFKKLVLDFSQIGKSKIDNIEGMCWGKILPNGKKSIVFVSDNNFSNKQISQIFVFEVNDL